VGFRLLTWTHPTHHSDASDTDTLREYPSLNDVVYVTFFFTFLRFLICSFSLASSFETN